MKNFLKLAFFILSAAVLVGCATYDPPVLEQSFAKVSKRLERRNVDIIRGDKNLTLVVPNKNLFVSGSANFHKHAYKTINLISQLSTYDQGFSVSVTGYFDSSVDDEINRALAMERANRAAQYIWKSRVTVNFIYADGMNVVLNKKRVSVDDSIVIEFLNFYK